MCDEPREKFAQLLGKARTLPKAPGVYLMKDDKGRVIYVGKAIRLPDRVSSYFLPSTRGENVQEHGHLSARAEGTGGDSGGGTLGPRKQPMLDLVVDFDVIECESEWEALLLENRLIKDIHPRFNVMLTDDKTFPYLVITTRDEYPGVYITRDPSNPDFKGSKVFGPFTNSGALRESVQLLQKVFKFRTCHLDIREDDDKRRFFRPCLLYPIKQCTAPCGTRISKADYRADIDRFIRFLESKRSVMLREMRQEMEQASEALDFEQAGTLRDQIKAIEKLDERGRKGAGWQPEAEGFYADPKKGLESLRRTLGIDEPIRCLEAIDIAHLQGGETVGSKVCFVDGKPLKNAYRRYRIRTAANDDYASIREVVSRRYREAGAGQELYPDVILIDGGLGQLHAAMEAFESLDMQPPMVISLAKKEELIYTNGPVGRASRPSIHNGRDARPTRGEPIKLGRDNPGLKLCQAIRDEAHRFAQHYHHILRRKKVVGK